MERDMDLVRKIPFAFAENEKPDVSRHFQVHGYTAEQIRYHSRLMEQAGLLEDQGISRPHPALRLDRGLTLTWAGHDFLEASRDEERWGIAKAAAGSVGGMTLDVLKATLIALATAAAKKTLGLP